MALCSAGLPSLLSHAGGGVHGLLLLVEASHFLLLLQLKLAFALGSRLLLKLQPLQLGLLSLLLLLKLNLVLLLLEFQSLLLLLDFGSLLLSLLIQFISLLLSLTLEGLVQKLLLAGLIVHEFLSLHKLHLIQLF